MRELRHVVRGGETYRQAIGWLMEKTAPCGSAKAALLKPGVSNGAMTSAAEGSGTLGDRVGVDNLEVDIPMRRHAALGEHTSGAG